MRPNPGLVQEKSNIWWCDPGRALCERWWRSQAGGGAPRAAGCRAAAADASERTGFSFHINKEAGYPHRRSAGAWRQAAGPVLTIGGTAAGTAAGVIRQAMAGPGRGRRPAVPAARTTGGESRRSGGPVHLQLARTRSGHRFHGISPAPVNRHDKADLSGLMGFRSKPRSADRNCSILRTMNANSITQDRFSMPANSPESSASPHQTRDPAGPDAGPLSGSDRGRGSGRSVGDPRRRYPRKRGSGRPRWP